MPKDPAELVLPILDGLLAPDESLQGWCLGTEQSTFSGHTTILGITDQRLVLQASTACSARRTTPCPSGPPS